MVKILACVTGRLRCCGCSWVDQFSESRWDPCVVVSIQTGKNKGDTHSGHSGDGFG